MSRLVAPVLATVQAAARDGRFDLSDGLTIAGAVLVAFGVWRAPNKEAWSPPAGTAVARSARRGRG